jgi:hypothetical protein
LDKLQKNGHRRKKSTNDIIQKLDNKIDREIFELANAISQIIDHLDEVKLKMSTISP